MTLQLLHSEVLYIYEENLIFFFISVPWVERQEIVKKKKKIFITNFQM